MNSFFNSYSKTGSSNYTKLILIPKTTDVLAVGKIDNCGLITRFNDKGNEIWSRKIEYPKSTCYLVQAVPISSGGFMVLGTVLTNSSRNRNHMLIRLRDDGKTVFSRVYKHSKTRNSQRLLQPRVDEFLVCGWHTMGPDKIECNRIDINGESIANKYLDLGGDDQLATCDHLSGNHLLYAGGSTKLGGYKSFLVKTNLKSKPQVGHIIDFSTKSLLHQIDAFCPIPNKEGQALGRFVFAGHMRSGDIFLCTGHYNNSNDLILSHPILANLSWKCSVRKLVHKNGFIYALIYNRDDKSSYVLKFDLSKTNHHETKLWVKTFQLEVKILLFDIIPHNDGFYLCGKMENGDIQRPVLVKTDNDLECCCTIGVDTKPATSPKHGFKITKNAASETQIRVNKEDIPINSRSSISEKTEFCPPTVIDKGKCDAAFVAWNALESRARTTDFSIPLQAQIRDGLWMLSRQWQMGEYDGEDGGSIIYSKLSLRKTKLNRYTQFTDNPLYESYNEEIPLEYNAEKTHVDFSNDWLLKLEAGNYWNKLIEKVYAGNSSKINTLKAGFLQKFKFEIPTPPDPNVIMPDPNDIQQKRAYDDALIRYNQLISAEDTWPVLLASNGRAIDGEAIINAISQPFSSLNLSFISLTDWNDLKNQFELNYLSKYDYIITNNGAWSYNHLEHKFQCRAPHMDTGSNDIKLKADGYPGGHLDWYNFDIEIGNDSINDNPGFTFDNDVTTSEVDYLIPAKLNFPGMPHQRWWQMEDKEIDFGNMFINTTDISKLLLLDFVVNYADNWYIIPLRAEVGKLIELEGIEVKDNFGIRTLINPANGEDTNQSHTQKFEQMGAGWGLFQLFNTGTNKTSPSLLLLPPSTPNILESKPNEKVNYIRDEMANMVWAIESMVPNGLCSGIDGHEASIALLNAISKDQENANINNSTPTGNKPLMKYQMATTVLENWIPFIPANTQAISPANQLIQLRSIELQRAKMPRTTHGFNNYVLPRTTLLNKSASPYFIKEEEVPKAGRIVTNTWQRTRWFNGSTFLWKGNRKQVGRGEGSSGLKFDQLIYPESNSDTA